MAEKRSTILGQLKYPLVFFGLALLIVETTLGSVLALNELSETAILSVVAWMGILFLTTVGIVAFLVYKVPQHIMLTSQESTEEIELLRERLERMRRVETMVIRACSLSQQLAAYPPNHEKAIKTSYLRLSEMLSRL